MLHRPVEVTRVKRTLETLKFTKSEVPFRPEAVGQSEANNKRSVSISVTTVPNRIDVKRQRSESQSEAAVS